MSKDKIKNGIVKQNKLNEAIFMIYCDNDYM